MKKETKKICICTKCGELHVITVKGPITSINFQECVCPSCVKNAQKNMDIAYA